MPILAFLMFFSNQVVFLVFGEGWEHISDIIPSLTVVGILKAIGNPGGAVILSKGRADIGFWYNVVYASIIIVGLLIGLYISPTIQSAVLVIVILSFVSGFFWHAIIAKVGKIHYKTIIINIVRILIVVVMATYFSASVLKLFEIKNQIIFVLIGGTVSLAIYSLYLLLFEMHFIKKLRK
jgi:O-antigen/teichoic acid export membrane protein